MEDDYTYSLDEIESESGSLESEPRMSIQPIAELMELPMMSPTRVQLRWNDLTREQQIVQVIQYLNRTHQGHHASWLLRLSQEQLTQRITWSVESQQISNLQTEKFRMILVEDLPKPLKGTDADLVTWLNSAEPMLPKDPKDTHRSMLPKDPPMLPSVDSLKH